MLVAVYYTKTIQSLSINRSGTYVWTPGVKYTCKCTLIVIAHLIPQELPDGERWTLTLDDGTENVRHDDITTAIGTRSYARPYTSWQRR